ncbi:hypothetical protein D9M69_639440 [compost metagenome]
MLSAHHVAVVNIDPSGRQGLVNWKTARSIAPGHAIAGAVCDIAHHWCIYVSALCIDQRGERYIKSLEVAPQGVYLAGQLTGVIEAYYRQVIDGCNPQHVVGSAWIAIPTNTTLDEAQAARIYDACGAWQAQAAA